MENEEGKPILKRTDKDGRVFLSDNDCTVYEARPADCEQFPHLLRGAGSLESKMWKMPDRATFFHIVFNWLEKVKDLTEVHKSSPSRVWHCRYAAGRLGAYNSPLNKTRPRCPQHHEDTNHGTSQNGYHLQRPLSNGKRTPVRRKAKAIDLTPTSLRRNRSLGLPELPCSRWSPGSPEEDWFQAEVYVRPNYAA